MIAHLVASEIECDLCSAGVIFWFSIVGCSPKIKGKQSYRVSISTQTHCSLFPPNSEWQLPNNLISGIDVRAFLCTSGACYCKGIAEDVEEVISMHGSGAAGSESYLSRSISCIVYPRELEELMW